MSLPKECGFSTHQDGKGITVLTLRYGIRRMVSAQLLGPEVHQLQTIASMVRCALGDVVADSDMPDAETAVTK